MAKSRLDISQIKTGDQGDTDHTDEDLGEVTPDNIFEEKEKRILYAERVLQRSEVCTRLGHLGKTAAGDGYAYLKATLTGMGLTDISCVKTFKHIQYLDVSNNNLDLEALQFVTELPFLVLIQADKNTLNSAALREMKYMQVIIMNNNNIESIHDVYQPELCTLELGYNKIQKVSFDNRMPQIKCLDFRYNSIVDIVDFDFPNLDSLYLAGNKITSLEGLENLVNLRILHLRNNPIKLLTGFSEGHKRLQYINLRNCKVGTLRQVKKLRCLIALETLVMKGCPYMGGTGEESAEVGQEEEDSEIRVEILATLPRLKRINKGIISPEERKEANDLMTQWLEEGEKDEEEIEDEQQEVEATDN